MFLPRGLAKFVNWCFFRKGVAKFVNWCSHPVFLKDIRKFVVGCSRPGLLKAIRKFVVGYSCPVFLKGVRSFVIDWSRLVFLKGIRNFVIRCSCDDELLELLELGVILFGGLCWHFLQSGFVFFVYYPLLAVFLFVCTKLYAFFVPRHADSSLFCLFFVRLKAFVVLFQDKVN